MRPQVVLEEGAGRRVIFSTFDPDCATLVSLKQPRYPVFFLTCGGTKAFADPRMNSLDAALRFALASRLQVGAPARVPTCARAQQCGVALHGSGFCGRLLMGT